MREIDTVTVKGSIQPMRLFTIDINIEGLERTQDPMGKKSLREKKYLRYKMKKNLFQKLYRGDTTTMKEMDTDHEFAELRRNYDEEFEGDFNEGY